MFYLKIQYKFPVYLSRHVEFYYVSNDNDEEIMEIPLDGNESG